MFKHVVCDAGYESEENYTYLDEEEMCIRDSLKTDIEGIYAIGDVVRTPLLAHVASSEGEIAVEHMAVSYTHLSIICSFASRPITDWKFRTISG